MELREALAARRTVHHFDADPVSRAQLEGACRLGCLAPNHRLTQPWLWALCGEQTQAALVQLAEQLKPGSGDKWRKVGGLVGLACATPRDDSQAWLEDYAACACAAQNFALALWAEGIGVQWSTGRLCQSADAARLLGFPETATVVGLFRVGRPKLRPGAAAERAERLAWRP